MPRHDDGHAPENQPTDQQPTDQQHSDQQPADQQDPGQQDPDGRASHHRFGIPRTVRVTAYVVGLALLLAGVATVTFGHRSSAGQAAALRDDERASRDQVRASPPPPATPTTPTPTATVAPPPTTTAPPTTTPPAVVTTPPAAATTKKVVPKVAAPPAASAGCASYSGNRLIACNLLPSFGFDTSEMAALDPMWEHESGWNDQAENSSSGAYGIPQALPGSKMASAGGDWQTNPATQIRWGLTYIKDRYGSPSAAWSYWQSNGWY